MVGVIAQPRIAERNVFDIATHEYEAIATVRLDGFPTAVLLNKAACQVMPGRV